MVALEGVCIVMAGQGNQEVGLPGRGAAGACASCGMAAGGGGMERQSCRLALVLMLALALVPVRWLGCRRGVGWRGSRHWLPGGSWTWEQG